ncbi:MAG: TIGR02680 family protein, partial [Acidimicrobiales bacterium]
GETSDRFLTVGAGLKAATSTRTSTTWFFMTESARVGEALHLGADMSLDRLRDHLGPEAVTQTATEHRRRVASKLFGVEDAARYGSLVHLLHRLRDPNIGNRVEAGELAALLRDALPPLSETALDKAAERFEALEQIKEQLERVEKTAAALERFLVDYAGYAKSRLAERARGADEAGSILRRAQRERERLAAELKRVTEELEKAESLVVSVRESVRRAAAELEALRSSEAYKQHRQLDDRRRTVAAKASETETAGRAARAQAEMLDEAVRDVDRAEQRVSAKAQAIADATADLERHARTAGLDPAVVPAEPDGIEDALAVAAGRRRAAEQVRRLALVSAAKSDEARRADEQAARSESELAEHQQEADEAATQWRTATTSWCKEVARWSDSELPAAIKSEPGAAADARELKRSLEDLVSGATDDDLAGIATLARELAEPVRRASRDLEGRAQVGLQVALGRLVELEAEHVALESETEVRPPRSRFRDLERDAGSGAAFYQLVEFVPGLEPDEMAGLEAALESSGLLDAWVSREGIVVHPFTHDIFWRSDGAAPVVTSRSLADVLVPANEQVAALLRTIALDEVAGDGPPLPYVSLDGRWSLPPLSGAWTKAAPELVGVLARRETRARRLAELESRLADQRGAVGAAEGSVAAARAAGDHVDRWLAALPDGSAVRSAAAEAHATERALTGARARHDEDRRVAEGARASAAVARTELEHAAAGDTLPRAVDDLDAVIRSASDLERGLGSWQSDWEILDGLRSDAGEADERRTRRAAAAAGARDREVLLQGELEADKVSLSTLEEAVGTSVDEVLRRIEEVTLRHRQAAADEPGAQARVTELAGARGAATERHAESERIVEEATSGRATAADRLARALRLPGVAAAALGADFEGQPDQAATSAAALLECLGVFETVSDGVILNRLHALSDGLAAGYDVIDDEDDGVKFVLVADDAGRQPLPAVTARVSGEAAAARERLAVGERETIERFLLGELGDEVRERLLEAYDLVSSANEALGSVHSSHGKGARLTWSVDDEVPESARAAAKLLVRSPRSVEEDAELRDWLMELIRAERDRDPVLGYAEHLRSALDYRRWHRFAVQVTDDAHGGVPRLLSPRLGLSQGEQRVLSYLALFAAASAHYDSLGRGCPRLLLLDDAFAKVDEPTHGRLLDLLVRLDLDFMITSERMWGCHPEVPSLEIYEALRDPSAAGVALVHFHWDGRERHLVGI